ncbi:MAG: hypothetical protein H6670_10905 [Anaerolineaceae bacterium]|nr:hypothetical protein [Anaerolineaceae bacterium]
MSNQTRRDELIQEIIQLLSDMPPQARETLLYQWYLIASKMNPSSNNNSPDDTQSRRCDK